MPFPINSTPNQVSQSITGQALLTNVGDKTVYLGPDSTVSFQNYELSLTPQGGVNWSGGDLWAATAPGETTALGIKYGANTSIVPGPTSVGIDGGVDIQQQVDSLFAFPSVDTWPPAGSIDLLNIGKYASLQISWTVPGAYSTANLANVLITWYNADMTVVLFRESVASANGTSDTSIVVPVRGAAVRVSYLSVASPIPFDFRIVGLTAPISSVMYTDGSATSALSGNQSSISIGTVAAASFASWNPPQLSGQAVVTAQWTGVTNAGNGTMLRVRNPLGHAIALATKFDPVTPNGLMMSVIVPRLPIEIRLDNATGLALTNVTFGIAYLGG